MGKVTIQESRLLRKGRIFDFKIEKLLFPGGFVMDMEVIRHPGAAAILAIDSSEHVLMLQQYRHAIGHDIWEIPAGTLEKDEDPLRCAKRELAEETGYSATQWHRLGSVTPLAGYSDERIHLFLARGLTRSQAQPDPDEILQVKALPLIEVLQMIYKGEIEDAKTVNAIFLSFNLLGYKISK
jgi:ADP-ribose pyrophosphatase